MVRTDDGGIHYYNGNSSEIEEVFEHREGISLDRVREARRNFQKFVSSEAEKGEENKQIGRVMNYEDNIQSMYGKKSSTYQFEEYMNMQMNSIDLSLTDFCHKSIQKFIYLFIYLLKIHNH